MAVYPTIPPLKSYQAFDPTSGATTDWEGAGLPDYTAPTAPTLTAPTTGSKSGTITFTATIPAAAYEDVVGTDIAKVAFYADDGGDPPTVTKVAEDTSGSSGGGVYTYSATYDTTGLANDTYTVFARVSDAAGNTADSAGVSITVNNT